MLVPSALYTVPQLKKMLIRVGFGPGSVEVHAHRLPAGAEPISADISGPANELGRSPYDLDILYTFLARA